MSFIFTILNSPIYISIPRQIFGWVGWFLLLIILGVYLLRERQSSVVWSRREWIIFVALLASVPLFTLFLGVRLPVGRGLPLPGLPEVPLGPAFMVFSALPWVLAGGLLGPLAAAVIAVFSGLLLALWDTHNLFIIIELAFLAVLFSWAVRQRYRTWVYRFLHHPTGILPFLLIVNALLYLIGILIGTEGPVVVRLDYGLTHFWMHLVATGGGVILAVLVGEILLFTYPMHWGRNTPLVPSPSESSLQMRFFIGTGGVVFFLLAALMVGDGVVSWRIASQMVEDRLASTAKISSESIPLFLEAGQNLILSLASDTKLSTASPEDAEKVLDEDLRSVPFFRQLFLFDANGNPVTGYPLTSLDQFYSTKEEKEGIQLALKGVLGQIYTVPPFPGEEAAQISFIAAMVDQNNKVRGVLLGRSDLASNPFTQPVINALNNVKELGGEGMILDTDGTILYHPKSSMVMTPYQGRISTDQAFYDDTSPDGTRMLVYYMPTLGHSWSIVLTVPASSVQQSAYETAYPLIIMILIITVLAYIALRFGLGRVTSSLGTLASESTRIAQGQLDQPLLIEGVDEVGQLRVSFEQMRRSLKARLEELNTLLVVSQGVASSLDIQDTIHPILEAAMRGGACMARVILAPDETIDFQMDTPNRLGLGPASGQYSYLDGQVLSLVQDHAKLTLQNLNRMRGLEFPKDKLRPGALHAVELRHENRFYGALWVAYDQPRVLTDEETRFLSMLAGEAALAAANARLYSNAEIGRQRLEAVLASTPDPVILTDDENRLLLSNPAAIQLPDITQSPHSTLPVVVHITQTELVNLLNELRGESLSREITFSNGKVYYATVSPVFVGDQPVGRVCILRDITHYKELDSMKSDFVATVSHDLRSPLTLMRGYATMLQMVGDLNEQQKGYVRKILSGVDAMSRLVNNLLDLGRIEAGVDLNLEPVSVVEVIEHVFSSLQLQATQKNIRLELDPLEGEHPVVEVDQALYQQAMFNLVENAIKYTSVGGLIQTRIRVNANSVVVDIKDNGIGVAPIDQPRLFEKFYRGGQRETYQQRGSGMGLAIVKSISERHHGRVWLESQLGKGSTFHIEVPIRQPKKVVELKK